MCKGATIAVVIYLYLFIFMCVQKGHGHLERIWWLEEMSVDGLILGCSFFLSPWSKAIWLPRLRTGE